MNIADDIATLFPSAVIVEHETLRNPAPAMLNAEEQSIRGSSDFRRLQFAWSRHCAHRAMKRLGVEVKPIVNGSSGAPSWPEVIVGSISHKTNHCVAVVAMAKRIRALGVDIERDAELAEEVWPQFLSGTEIGELVGSLAEKRRASKILFSAKESSYKALAPLFSGELSLQDIHVNLTSPGCFTSIAPTGEPLGLGALTGQYAFHEGFVLTGVTLPLVEDGRSGCGSSG